MNAIGIFAAEEAEAEQCKKERVQRRILRNKLNPFDLDEISFKKNFRLNKAAFKYLLDLLKEKLEPPAKSYSLNPIHKLTAVLRFFSEGDYQHGVGKDHDVAVAQSTFSRLLTECLDIFENTICPQWISIEMTEEEKRSAKLDFYSRCNFTGVILCVDGTHVKLVKPAKDAHTYYNRKGYYSLNVMLVCDNKMRIRCVDSRYPECNHDSHVWTLSDCRHFFEENYEQEERNSCILGDAGYPLEPWLLTPFRAPNAGSVERIYNEKHSKARNIIERVIGVLKNRFRCLIRQLHYSPKKVSQIVNVACALHNICRYYQVEEEIEFNDAFGDIDLGINVDDENTPTPSNNNEAVRIRTNILNTLI